jgi:hypothetical protein
LEMRRGGVEWKRVGSEREGGLLRGQVSDDKEETKREKTKREKRPPRLGDRSAEPERGPSTREKPGRGTVLT